MEHGQLGHFLIYHLLPILLIYGGLLGLVGLLTYSYKIKKKKPKPVEKKRVEILWNMQPTKQQRKKKRQKR